MKGFILVAHGSRREQSNKEIIERTQSISELVTDEFSQVSGAFLQYGTPNIVEQIEKYVQSGLTDIVMFPYFIAAGQHVVVDLPEIVEEFAKKYPKVKITLTKHLGAFDDLPALILSGVKKTSKL